VKITFGDFFTHLEKFDCAARNAINQCMPRENATMPQYFTPLRLYGNRAAPRKKYHAARERERDMNKASARHGHVTSRRALAAHFILTFLNIGGGGV
jgi:hypothetical protein